MKLIIFDLGQVLIHFDIMIAIDKIACYSPLDRIIIRNKVFGRPLGIDLEYGHITPNEFYQRLKKELLINDPAFPDFNEFLKIFNDIFWPNTELISLLPQLAQQYTLAVLSNTNELHEAYVKKSFNFWKYISFETMSFKVGLRKPDVKIFNHILEQAHTAASDALMIDDKQANIIGAHKAGLDGICFTDNQSLIRNLIERHILPHNHSVQINR
ncbi:MAG: HAD-IA family hydrolase [Elusimicrobia bacterium]|nr:HAD-IA family hydrolase [Elusimicrobiota bacterium]MBD3411753.1 HAD-IA family hydrolase [Elusimicrobiota bacterium]